MDVRDRVVRLLSNFNRLKWMMALGGIAAGVVCGFLVVLYRLGIEYGTEAAVHIYAVIKHHPMLIAPWLVAAVLAGLLLAWMVRLEPMASGSGIPQMNGSIIHGLFMRWQTIIPVRFCGGLLASLFGLSLGREGPSIQIGGCGAQFLAHRLRKNIREDTKERYFLTAGAAAGLSAAFSAPLSGMMFALEEVHRSFSPAILMGATAASLTADFVSKYCFGLRPVLFFGDMQQFELPQYVWVIALGIAAGLVGTAMNAVLLGLQTMYQRMPWWMPTMVSLIIALPVGLFLPQVLGGGSELVGQVWNAKYSISMLMIILVVKMLFTATSFGSGLPGGIFLPILSVGALSGGLIGLLASNYCGLPAELIAAFTICAMAGTLSACVKAPITSILLTVEMSGSLRHMLPVAAVAFIGLYVSDMMKTKPIYSELLHRFIVNQQAKLDAKAKDAPEPHAASNMHSHRVAAQTGQSTVQAATQEGCQQSVEPDQETPLAQPIPPERESASERLFNRMFGFASADTLRHRHTTNDVLEFPVQMGSCADGHELATLPWASGSLIVGLRRGEIQFVPKGSTYLRSGDYLIVLFNSDDEQIVRKTMHELCDASGDTLGSERVQHWAEQL